MGIGIGMWGRGHGRNKNTDSGKTCHVCSNVSWPDSVRDFLSVGLLGRLASERDSLQDFVDSGALRALQKAVSAASVEDSASKARSQPRFLMSSSLKPAV